MHSTPEKMQTSNACFFDKVENRLLVHSQNTTYALEGNAIRDAHFQRNAVKAILHTPPFFLLWQFAGLVCGRWERGLKNQ